MTIYHTGNPPGSQDPRDLFDNSGNLDQFMLSQERTYPDRLGVERLTLKALEDATPDAIEARQGAETARDVALTAKEAALIQAGVYATEAAGRAAVADGQAFKVQGSGDVAAFEYRRVSAAASTLIASYPASAAVTAAASNAALGRKILLGTVTKLVWTSAASVTVSVSAGVSYKQNNAGAVDKNIAAVADVVLATGQALIADLVNGPFDGAGACIPQVGSLPSASAPRYQTTDAYVLIANAGQRRLSGIYRGSGVNAIVGAPSWLESGGAGGVTYTPSTRTLEWSRPLICVYGGLNSRVQIPAGSIQLAAGLYQTVWLDLSEVVTSGNTPVTAIKQGYYYDNAAGLALGLPHALPLFFAQTDDVWGSLNGFPKARNTEDPGSGGTSVALDDVIVQVAGDTIKLFAHGGGPDAAKWIEILLVHETAPYDGSSAGGNKDVWRLADCYKSTRGSDGSFTRGLQIAPSGEWECAILEDGAVDYIGGFHGDEIKSDVQFFLDGVGRGSALANGTYLCKEFGYSQRAQLYRCNTQTVVADHVKRTRITSKKGLHIQPQNWVKWGVSGFAVKAAMLLMAPVRRLEAGASGSQVTNKAMRAPQYAIEDVSAAGFATTTTVGSLPDASVWGETSSVGVDAHVVKDMGVASRNFHISASDQYNKLYYSFAGQLGTGNPTFTPSLNEEWVTEGAITVKSR